MAPDQTVRVLESDGVRDPCLTVRVSETSPAARTLAVETFRHRCERRWLRKCPDGLERKWRPMGIVAVGHPTGRMPENLNGRLGDMFVVIRCACLPTPTT